LKRTTFVVSLRVPVTFGLFPAATSVAKSPEI
jgi:hypothetical protein